MFQRSQGPASSSATAPERELEDDIQDLFAENLVSGTRASLLLDKAQKAGVKMATKVFKKLPGMRKKMAKNFARDLRRKMRRNDHWPDPYYFDARLWDQKKSKEVIEQVCVLLPSEVLEVIWEFGFKEVLLGSANYDKLTADHLAWMKQQLNASELLGLGLHGDGVPCNYDRTESVIVTSINLPGLTGRNGRLRIPLLILPDFVIGENTFDDVYEIFAWDMRRMLTGTRATCRHDGTAWLKDLDKKRAKKES